MGGPVEFVKFKRSRRWHIKDIPASRTRCGIAIVVGVERNRLLHYHYANLVCRPCLRAHPKGTNR